MQLFFTFTECVICIANNTLTWAPTKAFQMKKFQTQKNPPHQQNSFSHKTETLLKSGVTMLVYVVVIPNRDEDSKEMSLHLLSG